MDHFSGKDWFLELIYGIEMVDKIYSDKHPTEHTFIRVFKMNVSDEDLLWHQDEFDRNVTILDGVGWKFQYAEELPRIINSNDKLFVPKLKYHRLLKGNSDLLLLIEELKEKER